MNTVSAFKLLSTLAMFSGFAVLTGCGEGVDKPDRIPELTPAVITITHDGQPVEGASVLLAPQSGSFSAAGKTDPEGKAVLKTDGLYEGVVPGEYRVRVTKEKKVEMEGGESTENIEDYDINREAPEPEHLLPEKYASFASTDLTLTVGDAPVEETFDLTSGE